MDRKLRKIDLPKTTKYCTSLGSFNEYLIIMSKNIPVPKFNHRRSVSTEFHMGCFPLYQDRHMAIFLCLPEDHNVIEIDEACIPRQSPQRFF
ncbi:hypothetical protein T06_3022 [Trichinella sp. T6]|nr:hypothetical protein T06_3022 [Trichinella sp. T6]